ncbi:MAG: MvdC/MvdD family ATP grasp protein [Thermoleophilia bacterium]
MSQAQAARGAVLIVTRRVDDHFDLVEPELAARGVSPLRLDTDRYAEDRSLARLRTAGGQASAVLRAGGVEIDGDDVGAVLFRHFHVPTAPGVAPGAARELAESELRAALEGALLSIDAHWVNHPSANRLARLKLVQLARATEVGMTVPDTCVTADPEEIRARFADWDGRMIAKLAGGQVVAATVEEQHVIYTTRLAEEDLRDDGALAACPAIYQRLVEKAYELRVTVVGERTFACRIDSQSEPDAEIDWRRAGASRVGLSAHELEPRTARRCVELTRRMGLAFSGIDLIVTPSGDPVFLELNAAGAWAWAQRATGLPIAAAIADELVAGAARPRHDRRDAMSAA